MSFNTPTENTMSSQEEGWQETKGRKPRKVPVFKPEEGQFTISQNSKEGAFDNASGLEKEKLFADGYLQARTGMLDTNQILLYFKALQEAAVEAHFRTYGEPDRSYLQSKITINVLQSKDTGKFGFANCHITNDPDHKMYWVFLGKGPRQDFPKEESVTLADGTVQKTILNFLEPAWIEMTEDQQTELVNFKARKFATKKISPEEYKDFNSITELPLLLTNWNATAEEMLQLSGDELYSYLEEQTDLINRLGNEIANALPNEDEDKISEDISAALSQESSEDIVSSMNNLLLPVRERSKIATHHKITAERLFVENIAKSTGRYHLYILKAPLWATKEELFSRFYPYNTIVGTFTQTYPCIDGTSRTITDEHYPHIWFEKSKDNETKVAHIAFTRNGKPDAAFALTMMTKFDLLGHNSNGDELVQEQIVFCWEDIEKFRAKKQFRQPYFNTRRQSDFKPGEKFNYQPSWTKPEIVSMVRSESIPLPEQPPAVQGDTILGIISNKATTSAGGQWSKPLNKQEFLRDDQGNLIKQVSYTAIVKKASQRGYDPNLRDDGNMDVLF
jgi:hypothetical protein